MHNTREKLFDLMMRDPCPSPVNCNPSCQYYKSHHCHAERYADHLIANGVTVQEWTSVNDGLPALHLDDYREPDGSRVQFEVSDEQWVVTKSGHQTKARYETGVVFQGWVGEDGRTVKEVTHWMSMSQPPTDKCREREIRHGI